MKAILRAVIFLPIAIILLVFAVANRGMVTLVLDPIGVSNPPLSLPIFIGLMLGILLGGVAVWVSEGRHRRAARLHRRDLERQRRENEELRRERNLPPLPPATLIG